MKILLIDDVRQASYLQAAMGLDAPTRIARTFDDGIAALKEGGWDMLYLDHDLAEQDPHKTGYGIVCFLEENDKLLPKETIIVSANPVGSKKMQSVLNKLYEKKTYNDLYDELEKHDWFYMMSDDRKNQQKGHENYMRLGKIAYDSVELTRLIINFHDYIWSGPMFQTERNPKPERK